MDLTLNDVQLEVLRWVADGCDMEALVTPTFKTSAAALRNRGLVELDRRRGRWNASLTQKGTYYLEHGRHPDAPGGETRQKRTSDQPAGDFPAPPDVEERSTTPTSATDAGPGSKRCHGSRW
ncbi:hypothetical protein [Arthrobacter pigmenti]